MNFEEWIKETQFRRDILTSYGKTGKPSSEELASLDAEKAIEMSDEAARILSQAESYLIQAKANAVLFVKRQYPDMPSREREAIEKNEVRDVQLIVDSCKITHVSCVSRYFNYKRR